MTLANRLVAPGVFLLGSAALSCASILLAYAVHPLAPLAAVAGLCGLVLAFTRPVLTLHLAVACIPLELFAFRFGGVAAVSPAEALFVLTGLAWLARSLLTDQVAVIDSPLNKPIALLLLMSAAGLLVAADLLTAAKVVFMWSSFALVYLMLVAEGTPRTIRSLLLVMVGAAAAIAAVALLGIEGTGPRLSEGGAVASGRATGSFAHPNVLAAFFVLVLPAAFVFAVGARAWLRPLFIGIVALMLAALAVSLSRGGLLSFAGSLLVLLAWRPARRAAAVATVVVLAITLAGGNPLAGSEELDLVTQRLQSIPSTSVTTGDRRREIWSRTPTIIEDHLLLGTGAGNYGPVAAQYGLAPRRGDFFVHAHNIALTIAAERGVIALTAGIWIAIALVLILARACRANRGTNQGTSFALAAGLVGFAIKGMVDYDLSTNTIAALFFVFAGAAVVMWRASRSAGAPVPGTSTERPESRNRPLRAIR